MDASKNIDGTIMVNTNAKVQSTTLMNNSKHVRYSKIKDFVCEKIVMFLTMLSALMILFIFYFVLSKALPVLKASGLDFILKGGFDQQLSDAYFADGGNKNLKFGALGLLMGSLFTTIGALLLALPLGVGTAVVIAELAPAPVRNLLQSVTRLLASIPSIIYGLVGLMIVVPFISSVLISNEMQTKYINRFQLAGNSLLAGIIVLTFMIMPIITAVSVDAIRSVPFRYKEASLALGLTYWRTIVKVVIPAAKSGIVAGAILATGRAIGEAIALSMVTGGIGNIPRISDGFVFFLTPVLTLASAIVNKSEAMSVPTIESALFACGVLLLISNTMLTLIAKSIERSFRRSEGIE